MALPGPIGVFDSGYGGLTVLKEIKKELPQYDFIYLGDNARAPYGSRSFEVIYEYTWQAVQHLFDRGCSLIILACNTASAKALRNIQQKKLPELTEHKRVLGVIRPSTEAIGSITQSGHVGILATEGTIRSNSYALELQKLAPDLVVNQHACPMWVPLVENNQFDTPGGHYFIREDLKIILGMDQRIDTLLLACTHYPILAETIRQMIPAGMEVIAQGEIVAASLKDYLERHPEMDVLCSKNGSSTYLTSENAGIFSENASTFLDETIVAEHISLH